MAEPRAKLLRVSLAFSAGEAALLADAAGGMRPADYCKGLVLDALGEPGEPPPPPTGGGGGDQPRQDAIEGKTLSWSSLKAHQDYSRCKVKAPDGGSVAEDVGLFDCDILPCGLDWTNFYMNNGLAPRPCKLRLVRPNFVKPVGRIELKATGVEITGGGSEGGKWGIKLRHGERMVVRDCRDLGEVTLRDVGHVVLDCPGARVALFAGNLPARYAEWSKKRKPGEGHNMYASADCYLQGVGSVVVGFGGDTEVKASGHVIHPALRDRTELRAQEGTRFEARG